MLFVVCRLFVVYRSLCSQRVLFFVSYPLSCIICGLLFVVCCVLFAGCCVMFVVWCALLCGACCLLAIVVGCRFVGECFVRSV